jgi:hypothetical protein
MPEIQELSEWEIKIRAERKVKYDTYEALYNGIAANLENGVGWRMDERRDSDDPNNFNRAEHLRLVSTSDPRMMIDFNMQSGANRGKVHVSGHWPQGGDNMPYVSPRDVREESPSINVSYAKGYPAIARDIERRFLPNYRRIFALCLASIDAHNSYEARKLANWQRVAAAKCLKQDYRHDQQRASINLPNSYGDVHMESADSVHLNMRSVPVDLAVAILAAIDGLRVKA